MTEMTVAEKLEAEEEIIEGHMDSFIAVGQSLGRIRDQKLYKISHNSFETYISSRWGKSIQWAANVLHLYSEGQSAEGGDKNSSTKHPKSSEITLTNKQPKPILRTQRHVKALRSVPPEQRQQVLKNAVKKYGEDLSAKQLQAVADEERKKAVELDPVPTSGDITDHVQAALDSVPEFEELRQQATALNKKIEELSCRDVGIFLLQDMSHVRASFDTIKRSLKFSRPYADCVLCTQAGCKVCRNTGWVPKLVWDLIPEENQRRSFVHK